MKTKKISFLKLAGNEEESFYQLGLKDAPLMSEYSSEVFSLYFPSFFTPNLRKAYIRAHEPKKYFHNPHFEKLCKAYAEGLKWKYEDYLQLLLVPELLNSFSGRVLGFSNILQACSSAFILDDKLGPLHLRYLDYPLFAAHTGFERVIEYNYNDTKVLSHGLVGMPFAGISAVTNSGLTMALHQKVSPDYYDYGFSVFGILHELLGEVKKPSELEYYLKDKKTLSRWGLYGCFQDGTVFEADVWGKNHSLQMTTLEQDNNWKYTNNRYLGSEFNPNTQPYLFPNYCNWRSTGFENKKKAKEKTSQFVQDFFSPSLGSVADEFSMNAATISAYTGSIFSPKHFSLLAVQGPPPKLSGEFQFYGDGEESSHLKICQFKLKAPQKHAKQVFQLLAKAQHSIHINEPRQSYHYLQMAKEIARNSSWEAVIEFYFLVVQYLESKWEKEYIRLTEEFTYVLPSLPKELQDYAHLFILRCNILSNKPLTKTPEIQSPGISRRYHKESLYRATKLKILKRFIVPRIDIMDIIHLYE